MKYAHIINTKLLGWYDDSIHEEIPIPNIKATDEVWQEAININANCYENGRFIIKDFRTDEEILNQEQSKFRAERDALLQQVDITINKAVDLGEDTKALRAYRQALRDATILWIMPESII